MLRRVSLTERDLESLDPLRLDRELAQVAGRVRKWRRRLRKGDGLDDDPFAAGRLVTSKRAFVAVRELPDYDPLRASLLAWVYRLAEQRIDQPALVAVTVAAKRTEHVVTEPERVKVSLSTLLARALAEPGRRAAWLSSLEERCAPLGDAVCLLWERRQEVAARMGLASPDAVESPSEAVAGLADAWLTRTADLVEGPNHLTLAAVVDAALGEDAREGWPRAITPHSLTEFFRGSDLFRDVDLDPGELPRAVAPASYLRALARVGAAWVDATAPEDQPFVIAHDPYGLRRRTMGALLGGLPAVPAFVRRALGLGGDRLATHRRAMARALLVESRAAALRVLCRAPALRGRSAFREAYEEHVARAFRVHVRADAAGALFRLHADDPQRFAGLLLAAADAAGLRDRHEEDWYRNPRAVEQLRDEARLSPVRTTSEAALRAGADTLAAELTAGLS
jgi:hypothetical protein